MKRNGKDLFFGVATALITPFNDDGTIDFGSLDRIIDLQLDAGVAALVVCGTTGEAPTLSGEEKRELIRFVAKKVRGRVPVIAGAGSNSTSEAVRASRAAEAAGADAVLSVTPYYSRPTAKGLLEHYRRIDAAIGLPIVVYVVPSRTCCDVPEDIWGELFALPNVVGVKDASGDVRHIARVLERAKGAASVWSGNDGDLIPTLILGGSGVVSVLANIRPRELCRVCELFAAGKIEEATTSAQENAQLCRALFAETNPIPVKAAMAELGLCREIYRLPLCSPSEATRSELIALLRR